MVILQASAHWVFGRALDETGCPDGCIALRRDHVQEFHTTPALLFRKRALEWQGLWPREISVPVPDLRDAGTILEALRREHRLAIVLTETRDGWNSIHCRVGKVDPTSATLLGFHGSGEWERQPVRADLSVITQLRYGSRYLRVYERGDGRK